MPATLKVCLRHTLELTFSRSEVKQRFLKTRRSIEMSRASVRQLKRTSPSLSVSTIGATTDGSRTLIVPTVERRRCLVGQPRLLKWVISTLILAYCVISKVYVNNFRINYRYSLLSNILYFHLLKQGLAHSTLDTLYSLDYGWLFFLLLCICLSLYQALCLACLLLSKIISNLKLI
jgi:hypothetical protein